MRVLLLASLLLFATLASAGCIAAQPEEDEPSARAPSPPTGAAPTACVRTDPPPTPPSAGQGQAAASNQRGAFSYSGQTTARTGSETYVWDNPSVAADISWAGQAATGSFTLILKDACDKEMFRQSFGATSQGGASSSSTKGQAGDWLVTLEFAAFTGQMGLSVAASG